MVKELIENDEKTTKYIIDNKILQAKEKDMNIPLRDMIINSTIFKKITNRKNISQLKSLENNNLVRENSSDSSEDEYYKYKKKKEKNISGKNEIPCVSPSETNNESKFSFSPSPFKSIGISNIESLNNSKKNYYKIDNTNTKIEISDLQNPSDKDQKRDKPNKILIANILKSGKLNSQIAENSNNPLISKTTFGEVSNKDSNLHSKFGNNTRSVNIIDKERILEELENKKSIKINRSSLISFENISTKRSNQAVNGFSFNNTNNLTNTFRMKNDLPVKITFSKNASSKSKDIADIDEFRKLRKNRVNRSVINSHTIIDYSMNKSDFIGSNEIKRNNISALNLISKDERERNSLIDEKIKIGNEKVKELILRTKKKGHYGPYFSLCRGCNEKNNKFYEEINHINAIDVLKIIDNN